MPDAASGHLPDPPTERPPPPEWASLDDLIPGGHAPAPVGPYAPPPAARPAVAPRGRVPSAVVAVVLGLAVVAGLLLTAQRTVAPGLHVPGLPLGPAAQEDADRVAPPPPPPGDPAGGAPAPAEPAGDPTTGAVRSGGPPPAVQGGAPRAATGQAPIAGAGEPAAEDPARRHEEPRPAGGPTRVTPPVPRSTVPPAIDRGRADGNGRSEAGKPDTARGVPALGDARDRARGRSH